MSESFSYSCYAPRRRHRGSNTVRTTLTAVALGAAVGFTAANITAWTPPRFAVAGVLVIAAGLIWICLPLNRKLQAAAAVCVIGGAMKISKSFFVQEIRPGRYVGYAGGDGGVTVTASFVAALFIIGLTLYRSGASALRAPMLLISGPLLFMAAGVASLLNADDPALTGFELMRQATLLIITLAICNLRPADTRFVLRVLVVAVLLEAAIAGLQYTTGSNLGLSVLGEQKIVEERINFEIQERATGTIGHANALANFFEITVPLMLALFCAARGALDRAMFLIAFAAGLAGLLLTFSRAGWLTLPLTLPLVLIAMYGRRLLQFGSLLWGFVLSLPFGAAAVIAAPYIARRLFSDDAGSAAGRWPQIRAAFSVIEQFPIFGVGLNNFGNSFPKYDTTHFSRMFTVVNHVVHNLYLLVWAEVGTVGFLAFLWTLLGPLLMAVGTVRHPADPWAKAIAVGGGAGLLAHMFHGLFDPGFKINLIISTLLACHMGLIGAAYLASRSPGTVARGITGSVGQARFSGPIPHAHARSQA